ncbi:hypothetical protein B0O99DRAFT_679926 [Bisporella sp. PMI_857]|nr:hypothetical protein B0O99DRAFT_679926 [Bisporella sp. PMI_857]
MSAVAGGLGTTSTPANNANSQRRVSFPSAAASPIANNDLQDSSSSKFSSLMNQKRGSLDDEAKKRRQSFNDQKPATGFVGSIWNSIMKGHDNK